MFSNGQTTLPPCMMHATPASTHSTVSTVTPLGADPHASPCPRPPLPSHLLCLCSLLLTTEHQEEALTQHRTSEHRNYARWNVGPPNTRGEGRSAPAGRVRETSPPRARRPPGYDALFLLHRQGGWAAVASCTLRSGALY